MGYTCTMDQQTLDFYEREAPRYVQAFGPGAARALSLGMLDPFLDRLAPGASVLELGCGGGRDTLHMLGRGFAVDATDGAEAMVREAEALTGQRARVLRFDELTAASRYDAVWAHASLQHQPSAGLPDILARIARALRPGGWFFANYKLGQGDARDELGRLYSFLPRADLLGHYRAVGWELEEVTEYRAGGLDKVERDWIAITVRKALIAT